MDPSLIFLRSLSYKVIFESGISGGLVTQRLSPDYKNQHVRRSSTQDICECSRPNSGLFDNEFPHQRRILLLCKAKILITCFRPQSYLPTLRSGTLNDRDNRTLSNN